MFWSDCLRVNVLFRAINEHLSCLCSYERSVAHTLVKVSWSSSIILTCLTSTWGTCCFSVRIVLGKSSEVGDIRVFRRLSGLRIQPVSWLSMERFYCAIFDWKNKKWLAIALFVLFLEAEVTLTHGAVVKILTRGTRVSTRRPEVWNAVGLMEHHPVKLGSPERRHVCSAFTGILHR